MPVTLRMSGLTVGQSYEFQFWANYSSISGNSFGVTATAGNAVFVDWNTTNADGGTGQFAIGTFIADNAAQEVTFQASFFPTFINGFQLRTTAAGPGTAVPEPGSALVGMLALGLCGARLGRRQRPAHC